RANPESNTTSYTEANCPAGKEYRQPNVTCSQGDRVHQAKSHATSYRQQNCRSGLGSAAPLPSAYYMLSRQGIARNGERYHHFANERMGTERVPKRLNTPCHCKYGEDHHGSKMPLPPPAGQRA